MGITSPSFPSENRPQGQPIPAECDLVHGLEDDGTDVNRFTNFMRFLAPAPRQQTTEETRLGENLFAQLRCTACHVPSMKTGSNPVAALAFKKVRLYSDLLLHDMGPDLDDGVEQGIAAGREWKTAPLWGLAQRLFFLHDGRALTIQDAISAHGGEAQAARDRFNGLTPTEQAAVLAFLRSL
jgi:CxxC motif-containing protein (DUF1111 family)